jgi:hypothetical protein
MALNGKYIMRVSKNRMPRKIFELHKKETTTARRK